MLYRIADMAGAAIEIADVMADTTGVVADVAGDGGGKRGEKKGMACRFYLPLHTVSNMPPACRVMPLTCRDI